MHTIMAKPLSMLVNRLEGNKMWRYVSEVERICSSSKDKILFEQWDRLLRIIQFAYEKIPFYRVRFTKAGITPKSIQRPDDLLKIPPLTRDDIRRNQNALLNPSFNPNQLIETATGGTTDSPIHLFLDRACLDQRRAATHVFFGWFGNRPGDSMAFLWGAQQDFSTEKTIKNRIRQCLCGRTLFLPSSYLNDDIMWSYYKKLIEFRPKILQAYPTPLHIFADFLERNKLELSIKNINVAAEHLYEHQRQKIEAVFGTKIFNWYGAREIGHIATECSEHNGMHINSFGVYIEILKNDKHVYDETGEIIITDLLNKAMPLIRYKIGDIGSLANRNCPCGSNLPLIDEITGRHADAFKKRDNTFVSGVALTGRIIKEHNGIKKLQIIQKNYEDFQLNIVKGEDYSEEKLYKLEEQICQFMKEPLNFDIHFVDDIPPEKSGKVLFCKSEITPSLSYNEKDQKTVE